MRIKEQVCYQLEPERLKISKSKGLFLQFFIKRFNFFYIKYRILLLFHIKLEQKVSYEMSYDVIVLDKQILLFNKSFIIFIFNKN